jgi:hypothetical protein
MRIILKTILFITFLLNLAACTSNVASGNWENSLKDPNGATITTSLTINEISDEFNGSLTTKVDGNTTDSLKLPVKNLDFSGYISGKVLVITQIKPSGDPYFRSSTLTVSDDGKTMILSPGGMIFNKR